MEQVIHKVKGCNACGCSQTLPVNLQTCECECHPLDRRTGETVAVTVAIDISQENGQVTSTFFTTFLSGGSKLMEHLRRGDTVMVTLAQPGDPVF